MKIKLILSKKHYYNEIDTNIQFQDNSELKNYLISLVSSYINQTVPPSIAGKSRLINWLIANINPEVILDDVPLEITRYAPHDEVKGRPFIYLRKGYPSGENYRIDTYHKTAYNSDV